MTGTTKQPDRVKVPVYLTVEPRWKDSWWLDEQGRRVLEGGAVTRQTKNQPAATRDGVVVKIVLDLPASAFLPLLPEATVTVNEGQSDIIRVEAEDPEMTHAATLD